MSLYTQDMSQIRDQEPISKGWKRFRIESWKETVSKNSNEPQIEFRLVCQEEPEVGRVMIFYASLQPQALFNLKALYKGCGYEPGAEGHNPDVIVGREFLALIEHEVYEGVERPRVKPYNIKSVTTPVMR